jgi:FixJ family two-component response regulator
MKNRNVKCVCVVDDNESYAEAIVTALKSQFQVRAFTEAALLLCEIDRGLAPDLILIDYKMAPMNGLEFCRELKEMGHSVPVVMVSGWLDKEVARAAMHAGIVDLLDKPFSLDVLHVTITRALAIGEERVRLAARELLRTNLETAQRELLRVFEERYTSAENALAKVNRHVYPSPEERRAYLTTIAESARLEREVARLRGEIERLGGPVEVSEPASAEPAPKTASKRNLLRG